MIVAALGVSVGLWGVLAVDAGVERLPDAEPVPHIYGATPATSCQWPTAVQLGGCSGTLVTPWVVLTAGHCLNDTSFPAVITFAEFASTPRKQARVDHCKRNPEWDPSVGSGVSGQDISYCLLAEPVYDIPATPIVFGCETEILFEQQEAMMVGFGADAEDGSGFGTKRYSLGPIVSVFPDPRDGVRVGLPLNAACSGDSGGPAYVKYPDGSWHVFGVVSGGPQPCGAGADIYARMDAWVPWIEEQSGRDITPCHDADGTWNPTGHCQGFAMDPLMPTGDWDACCVGPVSGASATCGPGFDAIADLDGPIVTVVNPPAESEFTGGPINIVLELDANDGEGHGVREVRLSINGMEQPIQLREPPYTFDASFPAGVYTLVGIGEDFSGNIGESLETRFSVDMPLPPLPTEDTGSSGGVGTAGSESTGGPMQDDGGDKGCGCRARGPAAPGGAALALLGLMALRRRRS